MIFSEPYRDFIGAELRRLKAYDETRPPQHPYKFHQHVSRVAKSMRELALALGMGADRAEDLYQASLIHDAGKRLLPGEIWDTTQKPSDSMKKLRRQHTALGVKIINDAYGADTHDPFLDLVRDLMAHHHESMDGSGWLKLRGDQLSREARMLCVCDAYDGYSVWRPHYGARDISPDGVIRRMRQEKTGQFDHDLLDVFSAIKLKTA